MTYITNLINALRGKPNIKVVTQTHVKWKKEPVYTKDPQGLIKRDLAILKKYSLSKPYKVGDPLELVAYKQGQVDLIKMIETKLIEPRVAQLQEP